MNLPLCKHFTFTYKMCVITSFLSLIDFVCLFVCFLVNLSVVIMVGWVRLAEDVGCESVDGSIYRLINVLVLLLSFFAVLFHYFFLLACSHLSQVHL